MGSILLIGAGSSSSGGGAGPVYEIFEIRYTASGSPASAVYGKHTVTYDASETSNFVDYLSAAAAKAIFEEVYGEVSVSLISKGYRVTVVSPTGNLADPTATPSAVYVPNDGTGTTPSKTSQRDYSAPVSAVQEFFTVDVPATPDTESAVLTNASISGGVDYDKDGLITTVNPPSGFTASAGGTGTGSVTLTQSSPGEIDDFTISPGNPGSLGSYVQGVTGVTGVTETYTITVGGSDGTITTTQGASIDSVAGTITSASAASGYTITSGGVGFNFVTQEYGSPTAVSDDSISGDGTGGASLVVNTQGVTPVTAVAEEFVYTTGGAIVRDSTYSNDGGTTTYTITRTAGLISAISAIPTGFSQFDGGLGNNWVTYAQDVGAAIADFSITSGNMTITVDTQGADAISEVLGQCLISYNGIGYFTFADGFTALPSTVGASGAAIKAMLNGVDGYNAVKVDNVVVVGNATIEINYATGESPAGSITIGGRTGEAIAVSVVNIQDGE